MRDVKSRALLALAAAIVGSGCSSGGEAWVASGLLSQASTADVPIVVFDER